MTDGSTYVKEAQEENSLIGILKSALGEVDDSYKQIYELLVEHTESGYLEGDQTTSSLKPNFDTLLR